MSSTLLYQALGVRGYRIVRTVRADKVITIHLEQEPEHDQCSACHSDNVIRHGAVERTFRTVPIGGKPVDLCLPVPRLGCHDCGLVRQATVRFARPFQHITRCLERYALHLLSHMTIQAVAEHLQLGWDTIKTLFKRHLLIRYGKPKLHHVRRIAIDEISIGHGHRYLTVVLDLDTGAVVFIGRGKDAKALKPFWKRCKRAQAKITAVATDMSPAYILAVREHLPKAIHVFDHFHMIKRFHEHLSAFRRELQREAEERLDKSVLKGTRWLILKNPENLNLNKGKGKYKKVNERQRLDEALRINQPLYTAYYMKEEIRHFWDQPDLASATTFLDDWCLRAEASELSVLKKMASTIQMHRQGMLNYHRCKISSGPLEGLNNKIKTLQRQAYGYRDEQFFHLRIYSIHQAKYALVG